MRSRATSTVLAAVVVATSLSGCTFYAAQTNSLPYDASDGISTTVGDVAIRNALLISDDGQTASLLVNFINSGVQNVPMEVSWQGPAGEVDFNAYIAAGTTESYGQPTNQIILNGIDTEPGALFPVYFQYGDNEGAEIMVPVLDGTLSEYTELVPESETE